MKSRVSEKGQVTIPKFLRVRLGISEGTELEFEERDGKLVARRIVPLDPIDALRGLAGQKVDVDRFLEEARGPAWALADGEVSKS
jgi:AbrB family looped-hinge helix DNA binding protein